MERRFRTDVILAILVMVACIAFVLLQLDVSAAQPSAKPIINKGVSGVGRLSRPKGYVSETTLSGACKLYDTGVSLVEHELCTYSITAKTIDTTIPYTVWMDKESGYAFTVYSDELYFQSRTDANNDDVEDHVYTLHTNGDTENMTVEIDGIEYDVLDVYQIH